MREIILSVLNRSVTVSYKRIVCKLYKLVVNASELFYSVLHFSYISSNAFKYLVINKLLTIKLYKSAFTNLCLNRCTCLLVFKHNCVLLVSVKFKGLYLLNKLFFKSVTLSLVFMYRLKVCFVDHFCINITPVFAVSLSCNVFNVSFHCFPAIKCSGFLVFPLVTVNSLVFCKLSVFAYNLCSELSCNLVKLILSVKCIVYLLYGFYVKLAFTLFNLFPGNKAITELLHNKCVFRCKHFFSRKFIISTPCLCVFFKKALSILFVIAYVFNLLCPVSFNSLFSFPAVSVS